MGWAILSDRMPTDVEGFASKGTKVFMRGGGGQWTWPPLPPQITTGPDYIWQMTPLALGAATLDDYCGFRQKMR